MIGNSGDTVFAGAQPSKVTVTEKYHYRQEISANPYLALGEEPRAGRIDVVVPYDGDKFFGRDAIKDVQAQIGESTAADGDAAVYANIGYLVLGHTQDALRSDGTPLVALHGAIPLQVPVRLSDLHDNDLAADQREAVLHIDYDPSIPASRPLPVKVHVDLFDPEDLPVAADEIRVKRGRKRRNEVSAQIVRQPAFSSALSLHMRITVWWPRRGKEPPRIRTKRVALAWPTITSLASTSLRFSQGGTPGEMQYDPATGCLEWVNIPLESEDVENGEEGEADEKDANGTGGDEGKTRKARRKKALEDTSESAGTDGEPEPHDGPRTDSAGPATPPAAQELADEPSVKEDAEDAEDADDEHGDWRMTSPRLQLHIQQPGQLRNQTTLEGEVEVQVDDELLSGIEARLFDAHGRRQRRGTLTTRTNLRLQFQVVLEDVFNRRDMSATHTLHFDEVVPDDGRVDDILAALRDRGFDVEKLSMGDSVDNPRWLISATRIEGPNEILLLLVVQGRRYTTRRRANTPGWHQYVSKVESGELRISVYGRVPRNSRELTTEVNELRQSLSTRFRHVQAQR